VDGNHADVDDDFEVVVRKTRTSNNGGPKLRKGREDAEFPGKSRDPDGRKYSRRKDLRDRDKIHGNQGIAVNNTSDSTTCTSTSRSMDTSKIGTNGTSYAKIVLRPKDDNEKLTGDSGAENYQSKHSMQPLNRQEMTNNSHDTDNVRTELDDFEMVVRKPRTSNSNGPASGNGVKLRKGKGEIDSSRPREIDSKRLGRRKQFLDQSRPVINASPDGEHVKIDNGSINREGSLKNPIQNGLPTSNGKLSALPSDTGTGIDLNDNSSVHESSSTDGTSAGEASDLQSNPEITKPQFVLAPPPKVNPWFVKSNLKTSATLKDKDSPNVNTLSKDASISKITVVNSMSTQSSKDSKLEENSSHSKSNAIQIQMNAKKAQSVLGKLPHSNLENRTQPNSNAQNSSPRKNGKELLDLLITTYNSQL